MDINSEKLTKLLQEIERQFRRKIVDYRDSQSIQYIDPDDNLSKLSIHNNHIIFGRRGCGKTTLSLVAIQNNNDDIISVQDMQSVKDDASDKIVILVFLKVLSNLQIQFNNNEFTNLRNKYFKEYKGISGVWNFLLRKRNKELEEKYYKNLAFLELLNNTIQIFQNLKDAPESITYIYELQNINSDESKIKISRNLTVKGNSNLQNKINGIYGPLFAKINATLSIEGNYTKSEDRKFMQSSEVKVTTKNEKKYCRSELVENVKEVLSFIFNEYKRLRNESVILYLDDFYLIDMERQPYIVQYLHDIYKDCSNGSFCFNICSLPSRLRINKAGSIDLSFKDDFSTIKLDNDLSELISSKEYLLKILVTLSPELGITKQDIESLFVTDEVLLYSVISTGGVPRDFLLSFSELVRTARSDNKDRIAKEHVYLVVKNLREDKDNNIEDDSDISPEVIRNAIKILNEQVIDGLKTSVILYPKKIAEQHDALLKNLVNLRYLHVIKETTSSETRKREEFTAYLVDMSFYAVNRRMKSDFDFRRFWERDADSRLNQLRLSKIWSFPDSLFKQ